MKIKSILAAFLLTLCFNSHSQIYYAGHNLSVYVDINPDTLINYYCPSSSTSSTESYYFDVNGDLQNDFQLNAYCSIALGGQGYEISIKSLNPSSYIRFGRFDSVYNNYQAYWNVHKVAKPLYYSDTVNSLSAKWDCTTLYLNERDFFTGTWTNITDWVSTNDEYIGIKYQNATDTIYGWVRMNCPNAADCYLKDYSFGGSGLGIKEFELGVSTIYPNPATDKIYIERTSNDVMEVGLFDIIGKQISQTKSKNQTTEIDVSSLSKGVYFARIKTEQGMCMKKIIVTR